MDEMCVRFGISSQFVTFEELLDDLFSVSLELKIDELIYGAEKDKHQRCCHADDYSFTQEAQPPMLAEPTACILMHPIG